MFFSFLTLFFFLFLYTFVLLFFSSFSSLLPCKLSSSFPQRLLISSLLLTCNGLKMVQRLKAAGQDSLVEILMESVLNIRAGTPQKRGLSNPVLFYTFIMLSIWSHKGHAARFVGQSTRSENILEVLKMGWIWWETMSFFAWVRKWMADDQDGEDVAEQWKRLKRVLAKCTVKKSHQ